MKKSLKKTVYTIILTILIFLYALLREIGKEISVEAFMEIFRSDFCTYLPGFCGKLDLKFKISYIYLSQGETETQPLINGSVLYSGDAFQIIFIPTEDSYVYVFQVDSANKLQMMNNSNPVKKGNTYYLLTKDEFFKLDDQIGTEKIYFLATRQRVATLEQQAQSSSQSQDNIIKEYLAEAQKKGTREMTTLPSHEQAMIQWEVQGVTFSASLNDLSLCEGCINVLTFTHR